MVSMHMTRATICAKADDDLGSVARTMSEQSVRAMPVLEDGRLVGIVSRSDVLHALPSDVHPFSAEFQAGGTSARRVEQVMSRQVVTVRPDDSVDMAVTLMDEQRLSCVVVTRGRLVVGVLSRSDILRVFRQLLCHEHATRLALIVPAGLDVVGAAVQTGALLAYAEHEHHTDRMVALALRAEEAQIDGLQESLQAAGARLLHRSAAATAS